MRKLLHTQPHDSWPTSTLRTPTSGSRSYPLEADQPRHTPSHATSSMGRRLATIQGYVQPTLPGQTSSRASNPPTPHRENSPDNKRQEIYRPSNGHMPESG